ncbi:hypothetical protein NDU88_002186 [Pleurodeles waltl]|uniref:Uncharacterized protein n=1 Tax=Pleurodeles waltl TaxID=8319 RepID=A0AAV7M0Q9_PLEWA|nr:hypothetical protein NDU88_002186 [Pleurodeles waltl]
MRTGENPSPEGLQPSGWLHIDFPGPVGELELPLCEFPYAYFLASSCARQRGRGQQAPSQQLSPAQARPTATIGLSHGASDSTDDTLGPLTQRTSQGSKFHSSGFSPPMGTPVGDHSAEGLIRLHLDQVDLLAHGTGGEPTQVRNVSPLSRHPPPLTLRPSQWRPTGQIMSPQNGCQPWSRPGRYVLAAPGHYPGLVRPLRLCLQPRDEVHPPGGQGRSPASAPPDAQGSPDAGCVQACSSPPSATAHHRLTMLVGSREERRAQGSRITGSLLIFTQM